MVSSVLFSSASDHYKTPTEVFGKLDDEFHFDFDPCPLSQQVEVDGLSVEWGKCNFVNPPYSQIALWCKKSYEEHKKGKTVIMLIPFRTDTRYWHDYIMQANEIRFIKGRLKFGDSKGNAPFPSAIIIFKEGSRR